jgi:hypothetical protein
MKKISPILLLTVIILSVLLLTACSFNNDIINKKLQTKVPVSETASTTVAEKLATETEKQWQDCVFTDKKNTDHASFRLIGKCHAEDKNQVFYNQLCGRADFGCEYRGAPGDSASYTELNVNYTKDKNNAYYFGNEIHDVDIASFKAISLDYAKDNKSVYYGYSKINGADPETFTIINDSSNSIDIFGKDKNNVYHGVKIIKNADPATFVVDAFGSYGEGVGPDLNYAHDKNYVFCDDKKIAGADSKTFQVVSRDLPYYAKDKNHVYKNCSILFGVNPKTFVAPKSIK